MIDDGRAEVRLAIGGKFNEEEGQLAVRVLMIPIR